MLQVFSLFVDVGDWCRRTQQFVTKSSYKLTKLHSSCQVWVIRTFISVF